MEQLKFSFDSVKNAFLFEEMESDLEMLKNKSVEILKKYFGYEEFREGQQDLIINTMQKKDSLGIMPTGGGKSLCYQIPALYFSGVTIVISPLISLMQDQVNVLNAKGIPSAFVNSTQGIKATRLLMENIKNNAYKMIYVAPERFFNDDFLDVIKHIDIDFIAVDEAHCISGWGNDFRPKYAKISNFIDTLPYRPVIAAYSATATKEVIEDIKNKLKMKNPLSLVSGFLRTNLNISVINTPYKNKMVEILKFIKEKFSKRDCGIIYCISRTDVDNVYLVLNKTGMNVTKYHAGMSKKERTLNQDLFLSGEKNIMVATNAFGMGIDKRNIRFVIHHSLPKDIEGYYQEIGRAGRDGKESYCLLINSSKDLSVHNFLINKKEEYAFTQIRKDGIQRERERLAFMLSFAKSTDKCYHSQLLAYFGDDDTYQCEDHCDICNNK